jgi:hypothetical protein
MIPSRIPQGGIIRLAGDRKVAKADVGDKRIFSTTNGREFPRIQTPQTSLYNAAERISCSSDEVRGRGFAFMLLAAAAFSQSVGTSFTLRP